MEPSINPDNFFLLHVSSHYILSHKMLIVPCSHALNYEFQWYGRLHVIYKTRKTKLSFLNSKSPNDPFWRHIKNYESCSSWKYPCDCTHYYKCNTQLPLLKYIQKETCATALGLSFGNADTRSQTNILLHENVRTHTIVKYAFR